MFVGGAHGSVVLVLVDVHRSAEPLSELGRLESKKI
jgi:hypothetical protein